MKRNEYLSITQGITLQHLTTFRNQWYADIECSMANLKLVSGALLFLGSPWESRSRSPGSLLLRASELALDCCWSGKARCHLHMLRTAPSVFPSP